MTDPYENILYVNRVWRCFKHLQDRLYFEYLISTWKLTHKGINKIRAKAQRTRLNARPVWLHTFFY